MARLLSLNRRMTYSSPLPFDNISPTIRRVWIPDSVDGFLPGWIKSQSGEEGNPDAMAEVVVSMSGEVRTVPLYGLSPMNPPQFDGVDDIADLTHLNEASVVSNLKQRYGAGSIYVSAEGRPSYKRQSLIPMALDVLWVSWITSDGDVQFADQYTGSF